MRGSTPTWYARAASMLAAGKTQIEVAEAIGTTPKTLRRHLDRPDGLFKSMVEQARAAQAAQEADELAPLRDRAREVVQKAVDSGDVNVALKVFAKTTASPADASPPQEGEPEPEISVEDAYREVALSLTAAADLARLGTIPPDLVETLRAACRGFLADDLQSRPPVDVEAERVEVAAAPEPQPAAGAAVIPIRT